MWRKLASRALDPTVVLSYTTVGARLRRPLWAELDRDLAGKRMIVTGANSGLGRVVAERLAGMNARVTMVCRSAERGQRALEEIRASTKNDATELALVDVSDRAAVAAFARGVEGPVDALVLNAGVLLDAPARTPDGLELTFATNVIGGFLMTRLLEDQLEEAAGRLVHVTSGGMYTQRLDLARLESGTPWDGVIQYAQTKRAQVILGRLWAKRLKRASSTAMHPGWADTPGVEKSLPRFHKLLGPLLRSPEEGADTAVWLAAAEPRPESGRLYFDREARREHLRPGTRSPDADEARLWARCMELTEGY